MHRGRAVLAIDCVLAGLEWQRGRPLNSIVRHALEMETPSPQEALEQLCEIVPEFRDEWRFVQFRETHWGRQAPAAPEFDGVMTEFLGVFLRQRRKLTPGQLRDLGAWIHRAISTPSELEDAVVSCFLQEMRRYRFRLLLSPYLTSLALEKSGVPLARPVTKSRGPFSAPKKKQRK
jgi:hypothetical protein